MAHLVEPEPLVLRIPDLARVLGVSEVAARRMVERGEVPARKWGARIVVLRDELLEHLHRLPGHQPPKMDDF
jgi:excisionase family DNA binding protein